MAKHLLFCSYGAGHITLLLPLIQRAIEQEFKTTILAPTTASSFLKIHNIPHLSYKDLLPKDSVAKNKILRLGSELSKGKTHPSISQIETDAYHGLCYQDLIAQHGKEQALKLFNEMGRLAFSPIYTMTRFLQNTQPDVVISTNSPRTEKAILLSASALDIPALCANTMHALMEIEWLSLPYFANTLCVTHPSVKKRLIEHGRPSHDIVVTGNPSFDHLASTPSLDTINNYRASLGASPEDKIILWASQPVPEVYNFTGEKGDTSLTQSVCEHLVNLISQYENWHLVIRAHPSDDNDYLNYNTERIHLSTQSDDLTLLMHASDTVVTFGSTVGVQAAILGKPVLSLQEAVFSKYSALVSFDMAVKVDTFLDIERHLLSIFKNIGATTAKHSQEMNTGHATDAIWSQIMKLL